MITDRRGFIKGTACAAMAATAAGCITKGGASSDSLVGFRTKPMDRIRMGFIGVGERGMAALHRVMLYPGLELAAICDLRTEAAEEGAAFRKKWNLPGAGRVYAGKEDSWKGLCEDPEVDAVYIATPQGLHAQMEIYALNCGKHVLCEVPGAETIAQCREIVRTAEKAQRHCYLLENRCFREMESLALSLAKQGVLGELAYAEAAYIHNLNSRQLEDSFRNRRLKAAGRIGHVWNTYPTHPLGPICRYFDINRGDRMTKLVTMSTADFVKPAYVRDHFPEGAWQRGLKFEGADMITTLIGTERGRTIELKQSFGSPRPYTRINFLGGTKGSFQGEPFELAFSAKAGAGCHSWFDAKTREAMRVKYAHPMWRQLGALVKEIGSDSTVTRFFSGHGGPDFLMDLAWIYAFRLGLPMPQDVYDLATWSSIVELSRQSVLNGSIPVEIPDFTGGGWKVAHPEPLKDFDLDAIGFDAKRFRANVIAWSGSKLKA